MTRSISSAPADGPSSLLLLVTEVWHSMGGIETHNQLLCRAALHIAEGNVHVISLNDDAADAAHARELGLSFDACGRSKTRFIIAMLKRVVFGRYTMAIFAHLNLAPLAHLFRTIRPRMRLIVVAHGVEAWERRSLIHRTALRRADRVVAVSRLTRARLAAANNVPKDHIQVIHNALLPEVVNVALHNVTDITTDEAKRRLGLDEQRILLTVGRLSASEQLKGHDRVIAALPGVVTRFPDVQYVIVGDGDDQPRLSDLAEKLGVSGHVLFVGPVLSSTLPLYYRACDVYVMPSRGEGFGLVFIEAMLYGRPVVASTADAGGEPILSERTGTLVDPLDTDALARALCELLSDGDRRRRFGEAGHQRVLDHFLPARFYDDFQRLVASLR